MNSSGDKPSDGVAWTTGQACSHARDAGWRQGARATPLGIPGAEPVKHGPDDHGPGNQTVAEYSQNRSGSQEEVWRTVSGECSSTPI